MKRELMGLIVKREDGSEQVNYDDDSFPSYIYDGWIKPNVTWEKVPHFHEDIENRIKVRDFTGNLKTYDAIIRSDMLFNEDMTAVAVKWQEPDLSSHVGWCDADGNVTDVTAMIYNQNSDFDKLPQNQYPLFGPDNSLWFYDYNITSKIC